MAQGGMVSGADAVTAVADELYGLPLEEFIAVRTERARQARGRGDREAAAAIGKLAKPNTVGWLANQLVRRHGEEIGPLLDLGDAMRQATAMLDTDQLRQLSRQQRQLVQALLRHARDLAAGQALSDSAARGLTDTLHAALADEDAAQQLSQGRLTSGLAHSGFPGIAADAPTVLSSAAGSSLPTAQRTGTATAQARQQDAERARRDEDEARRDADDASAASEAALAAFERADRAARAAADEVGRLQAGLDAAASAQTAANRARRQAQLAADQAGRIASQAALRLKVVTARREKLEHRAH